MKHSEKMAIFLVTFFLLIITSYSLPCEYCDLPHKASYFLSNSELSSGACGYGSLALSFNGGYLASGIPSIYNDGAACGACFQVRCKNVSICSEDGTKVVLTDLNQNNKTSLVLSNKAFMAMANYGMAQELLNHENVDVEYRRIPCEYNDRNLSIRVEETSQKPHYLAIQFLYLGGLTDISIVNVARVGFPFLSSLIQKKGTIWYTDDVPEGPLQFQVFVTYGFDGRCIMLQNALPEEWKAGEIYDTGLQINDNISQVGPCHCSDHS